MKNAYTKTPYPLVSILFGILLLAYFYLQVRPEIANFYPLPEEMFVKPLPEMLLLVYVIVALIELRYVQNKRHQQQLSLNKIRYQVNELLENKKQLNAKAHVYANHADKLKLFISDKLLEYIEYDEKFLHFKSIASEVRHNGVISYDKIETVLNHQMENTNIADAEEYERLKSARDSLRYLWDLLDLSTADNIALHIANQVCESEEVCFQSELQDSEDMIPDRPIFNPKHALVKALARCFGSDPLEKDDSAEQQGQLTISEQDRVWIRYEATDNLLGNENHIILALENIISNAQFFNGRKGHRQSVKRSGIAIQLAQNGEYICYRIYNRGPHIDEEAAVKLFQLGYSTRRVKEHHGKGLGLYFVNEVIKGYDGKVAFSNIYNKPDVLSLRIELSSGEVITDVIELVVEDGLVKCRKSGTEAASESFSWQLPGDLVSIEVTHQSDQTTHRIAGDSLANSLTDPGQPAYPRWCLTCHQSRHETELQFNPLDISGVEFLIKLPSLTARLEGDLLTTDELDMDSEVMSFAEQFKSIEHM